MNNPTMYEVTGPEQEILNLCLAKGYVPWYCIRPTGTLWRIGSIYQNLRRGI